MSNNTVTSKYLADTSQTEIALDKMTAKYAKLEKKHELGHYEMRKIVGKHSYRRWSGEFYRVRRKFIKGL